MQFQGKLKSQTSENGEKPNFGLQFGSFGTKFWFSKISTWLWPTLDVRHCCNLQLYAISRKTNNSNSRKWRKTSFWTWFRPVRPKFGLRNIFFKNRASSITRYHGQLSSCTISEKINYSILKKVSVDTQTDRITDVSDVIGRFPTIIERPTLILQLHSTIINSRNVHLIT